MSTIDLPNDVAARFEAEAERRGNTVDELLVLLAEGLPSEEPREGGDAVRRKLGFVSLGASSSGRGARDADEMLAEGFGRD